MEIDFGYLSANMPTLPSGALSVDKMCTGRAIVKKDLCTLTRLSRPSRSAGRLASAVCHGRAAANAEIPGTPSVRAAQVITSADASLAVDPFVDRLKRRIGT
jgi:hypothetical protein